MSVLLSLLTSAITIMTPLLLAATGGLFTELSGMLNIALEGLMLVGAFASIVGTYYSQSIVIGILIGIMSSMILASIMASITLYLKANVFITGLATNLFASGITVVLSFHLFNNKGVIAFDKMPPIPRLFEGLADKIPIVGHIFFGHTFFTYLSIILLIVASLLIYNTPFGFRLRAAGLYKKSLTTIGLSTKKYRFIAFLLSAVYASIAGAMLSVNLGAFVPNITSGKGWIALVVIFLGQKKPLGLLIASFIFGFSEAFSNYAQGLWDIPSEFILALPYVFTLVAIILFSIYDFNKKRVE